MSEHQGFRRDRRSPACAAAVAVVLALGCAGGPRVVAPDPSLGDATGDFETPRTLQASDWLTADELSGPNHRVREAVREDGRFRHYAVDSDFGELEAEGDDLLRVRLREVAALAALDDMQKRDEFARAMAAGLKSPFVAAWNLLRNPVDSILGVPEAAWETLQKTAALARNERGELEDSGLREFIGFETKKRELAYELGVDPYSSNALLQKQMNRFAWASYLGGLPFALVPFQGEKAEVAPAGVAAGGDRLREILRHYTPEDLRRLNRVELAVMGVPQELADAFLAHPWYSPRHATVLVEALVGLDLVADRVHFVEAALEAGSEREARNYQRAAQLLRLHHERELPLARLGAASRTVLAFTREGELIVPLIADHVLWSPTAARLAERIVGVRPAGTGAGARLLVSGTISERARLEFTARGIAVVEQAFAERGAAP